MSNPAGTVNVDVTPCPGGSNGDMTLGTRQVEARIGQSYTMTFGGTPPYNLTKSIYRQDGPGIQGGTVFCGEQLVTLSNNTYTWLVNTFDSPRRNESLQLVLPGDAVMFAAVEKNSTIENRWFTSDNYTIIAENATTTSAGMHTITKESSGILSPLLLCLFLSIMFRRVSNLF